MPGYGSMCCLRPPQPLRKPDKCVGARWFLSCRLAILGAQRRGQRLSAATALWVDDALFWLGDEEESCLTEGATLPAEDMALLDVAFQYLGIHRDYKRRWGRPLYRKECSACVRAWARRRSRYIGAASRLRPCSALESSSLS